MIAEIIKIAVSTMFNKHYYTFGGRKFHQARGGPIGLRGTCAIARAVMQLFDGKWEQRLVELGVEFWLNARYMDDGRIFLPPIKRGWRWEEGRIQYCKRWEEEDRELEPEEVTRRIIAGSMAGIESYLEFTTEVGGDFVDGWLPTLDAALKVTPENQVLYKFYEKPEGSKSTVHYKSAMGESTKHQILSQEMIRRLMNTSEGLPEEQLQEITDNYAVKLHNSGYNLEQIRRIILAGIKGYGAKKARCEKEGRSLRRTAGESQGARYKSKLLGKSTWFKKKSNQIKEHGSSMKSGKGGRRVKVTKVPQPSTVLFVEQTQDGELAARLREMFNRLEPILGFTVKTVEKTGSKLGSKFPLYNLWDGTACGRQECIPCGQGAEFIQSCTKTSVVYENVCQKCNPGAGGERELKEIVTTIPTAYIGETSRSICERTKEHWSSYRSRDKDSHLLKHQELCHKGAPPKFIMRVVNNSRTALERQTREAVRIRRRGGEGAILNSKAEYNRSYIPRLQLEEQSCIRERELEEKRMEDEMIRELDLTQAEWEQKKARERGADTRRVAREQGKAKKSKPGKRKEEEAPMTKESRSKRRKYELVSSKWGEQEENLLLNKRKTALAGGNTNKGVSLRNSQEYEGVQSTLDGGNTSIGKHLGNSQEYEGMAGGNTSNRSEGAVPTVAENPRNSQEYEGVPSALAGGNTSMGRNLRNSQEYEEVPGSEGAIPAMTEILRNSQEYEGRARGNTSKGNEGAIPAMAGNLRNSQEYEGVMNMGTVNGEKLKVLKNLCKTMRVTFG